MYGDKVPLEHQIETKEGWSEKLFENLLVYLRGRYSPCISTVQAMVIAQNHRASLDEKMTSTWLLNSAVSLFLYVIQINKLTDFVNIRQFVWSVHNTNR